MSRCQYAPGLFLFLLSVATVVGCSQSSEPGDAAVSAAATNAFCPIMGGPVSPDGGTVEWNGQTIGFCCDGCDDEWQSLSESEKEQKLSEAKAKAAGDADDAGEPHTEHGHS